MKTKLLHFGTLAAVLAISVSATANHPEGARQQGYQDGSYDGSLEGQDRGRNEGEAEGYRDGQRSGYASCSQEEERRHYDSGFSQGYADGQAVGSRDGVQKGLGDGEVSGRQKGDEDGRQRANNQAYTDATPEGTRQGQSDAENSDARDKGTAAGLSQGDQDALQKAQREDYPKARQQYRDARFAEAIEHEDRFSQRAGAQPVAQVIRGKMTDEEYFNSIIMLASHVEPEHFPGTTPPHNSRFYRPRPSRHYTPPEVQAYNEGYYNGYGSAYTSTYRTSYSNGYRLTHMRGRMDGCAQARRQSYTGELLRGQRDGYQRGYDEAFRSSYAAAFSEAESSAFPLASQAAYQEHYPKYYAQHFEKARSDAYAQRYGILYRAAYDSSRQTKFAEAYPIYARQESDRGSNDERQDFENRPVRLISVRVTETIANDVLEPGETLRFEAKLRNFAGREISASAVKVKAEVLDGGRATLVEGESLLAKSLASKSMTTVSEALGLVPLEAADGKVVRIQFSVFYEGRLCGSETIDLRPSFLVQVGDPAVPQLREGMPAELNVDLVNRGSKQTASALRLRLVTDSDLAEVINPEKLIGSLDPSRSTRETFTLIARTPEERVQLPLSLSLNDPDGRRIGLFDRSKQVPVLNDYRVRLRSTATGLRHAGVTRLAYRLRNANSRWVQKGLQLTVLVESNDGSKDSFVVVGPNPQYLAPLENGEFADFVIPVYSKNENSGGTLWLKVQEDGRDVVEHRVKF